MKGAVGRGWAGVGRAPRFGSVRVRVGLGWVGMGSGRECVRGGGSSWSWIRVRVRGSSPDAGDAGDGTTYLAEWGGVDAGDDDVLAGGCVLALVNHGNVDLREFGGCGVRTDEGHGWIGGEARAAEPKEVKIPIHLRGIDKFGDIFG